MSRRTRQVSLAVVIVVVVVVSTGCATTRVAVRTGSVALASSPLQARAWMSTRSPDWRSASVFVPWRRILVVASTAMDSGWATDRYACPWRFVLVTLTLMEVPVAPGAAARVPLSTTFTFGLHPTPVAAGLPLSCGFPFPGGCAASAADAARQATASTASSETSLTGALLLLATGCERSYER